MHDPTSRCRGRARKRPEEPKASEASPDTAHHMGRVPKKKTIFFAHRNLMSGVRTIKT